MYAKLTAGDIRKAAKKYLVESARTVVTLTGDPLAGTAQ
jgi:hypothetical protein